MFLPLAVLRPTAARPGFSLRVPQPQASFQFVFFSSTRVSLSVSHALPLVLDELSLIRFYLMLSFCLVDPSLEYTFLFFYPLTIVTFGIDPTPILGCSADRYTCRTSCPLSSLHLFNSSSSFFFLVVISESESLQLSPTVQIRPGMAHQF